MNKSSAKLSKFSKINQSCAGFTLLELLLAVLISTIVISIAGFGIVTILAINKKAEAKIERRIDLSRAFDFITTEIRMARRINRTATTVANGTTITVDDVVASSGLNLSDLGSYGTIVLYLEIPITSTIPANCPAGGPNAGLPPPAPADYDRVVYDIRPHNSTWLGPLVINRYGRIPSIDGTIDPCKNPVSSDTLVDSIADTDTRPTSKCDPPALLEGSGGFYACVNGSQVDLYLRSKVIDTETHNLTSRAVSRIINSATKPAPVLSGTRQSVTNMNLSWTWAGSGSPTFKLYQMVKGAVTAELDMGSSLNTSNTLAGNNGDKNCYVVTATIGSYTSGYSNQVCEFK